MVDSFYDNTFPDSLLEGTVETISYVGRFKRKEDGIYFDYFIRKKEPKKKYVPFDLTNDEDRAKLRGAWVRIRDYPNIEYQIIAMSYGYVFIDSKQSLNQAIDTEELFRQYEFIDDTPCGRLVED